MTNDQNFNIAVLIIVVPKSPLKTERACNILHLQTNLSQALIQILTSSDISIQLRMLLINT